MRRPIYNLEFPSWCSEITISGYKFVRANNYQERLQKLQQPINIHAEFPIIPNTGEHSVTAYVELPYKKENAIFNWGGTDNTALMDILLLISLFNRRDVFAGPNDSEGFPENEIITRDARCFLSGGVLRNSIQSKPQQINIEGIVSSIDIGFEEGLNTIYRLVRSAQWQNNYRGGYFLFLAKQAFHVHFLESAFIQCWTIWEHLFSILNQKWLSRKEIIGLSSFEKIAFLMVEYALVSEIDDNSRKRLRSLSKIRNRLVHYGRFPEGDEIIYDAILFIRLTEYIIAKILDLLPSNLFNTMERLEEFLKKKANTKQG